MVFIVTKFSSSSFIWHQKWAVMPMHSRARTMWNLNVKIRLRRITVCAATAKQRDGSLLNISISLCFFVMHVYPNLSNPPPPPPLHSNAWGGRYVYSQFSGESGVNFGGSLGKISRWMPNEWYPLPEIEGFILFPRDRGVRVMGNEHMYPLVLWEWGGGSLFENGCMF